MLRYFTTALSLLLANLALAQAPVTSMAPSPGLLGPRVSYHLDAGMQFAGRYGSASYLSPTATYQLSNRFSLFTGVTFLRTQSNLGYAYGYSAERPVAPNLNTNNHLILQAGGTYLVSPRLALTGSAWKDLSKQPYMPTVNPYAGFTNMGSGVNIRADYQLTEHLSVSGGVRVTQGAPGSGGMYGSPMLMPMGY